MCQGAAQRGRYHVPCSAGGGQEAAPAAPGSLLHGPINIGLVLGARGRVDAVGLQATGEGQFATWAVSGTGGGQEGGPEAGRRRQQAGAIGHHTVHTARVSGSRVLGGVVVRTNPKWSRAARRPLAPLPTLKDVQALRGGHQKARHGAGGQGQGQRGWALTASSPRTSQGAAWRSLRPPWSS